MRLAAVILMALGLAACGSSPPVAFYTLDPVPPGDQPRSAYAGPPLQVGNVAVPPMLDREELVTVAGSNRVAISDRHRWAAPLSAMIRRVPTTDLRARLGAASVRSPGEPVSGNSCRIALDIQQFAGEPGGSLTLEGDWAAQRGSARVSGGHESIREQAGANVESMPAVMSRALGVLASRIAGKVQPCAGKS